MTYSTFGNQHEIRMKNSLVKLTNPQTPIAKKSPNIPHSGNIYKGRYSTFGNYLQGRYFTFGKYLQGEIFHIREIPI